MTDTDKKEKDEEKEKKDEKGKQLRLNRPGTLSLKKTVEGGQVRQNFSHGRSKVVAVEVRKKRTFSTGKDGAEARKAEDQKPDDSGDRLTSGEKATRARALEEAKREEERRKKEAEEARKRAEEEARRKAEEAARAPEPEPESEEKAEEDTTPEGAEGEAVVAPEEVAPPPEKLEAQRKRKEEEEESRRKAKKAGKKAGGLPREERRRKSGRLTLESALEDEERVRSLASVRRAREKERQKAQESAGDRRKVLREVVVPESITVQELANRMAEKGSDVVKTLMQLGVMATINQSVDADTAELVATEMGHKVKRVSASDVEDELTGAEDKPEDMEPRPPVVTVMGHVDHGKTALLDALRATDVAGGEAGGITQHIGAYQVTLSSGQKITFLDTPGHEAFTAMRARGAQVTDIVVLVVAADDSIMPQTIEAIRHAKAAKVPIIVAVNKIDKPDADPARVRNDLLSHELVPEEMGGDIQVIDVSAKEKTNLDKLEESILLQAEIMELKANPKRRAEGIVVEAKMEQGRGSVATVIIQRGTLKVGDVFIAGSQWGRVRALLDDYGKPLKSAAPAAPAEVLGLNGTPQAGDDFVVVGSESKAREIAEYRERKEREQAVAIGASTAEDMFERIKRGEEKTLPVVIKADVQGSVEAIIGTLEKISSEKIRVEVLHSGVGGINESDVSLAAASNALIVGFNVRANPQARAAAKQAGVDMRYYSIIYDVAEDMEKAMKGALGPEMRENFLGYAEIREVFRVSKVGNVAGCMVTEGTVKRGAKVRLLRDDVVIHEGTLATLKRFQEDVKEVKEGMECGMSFENYQDIREGDVIECFEVEEVAAEL